VTDKKRTPKTPEQRAQEAVDVCQRKIARAKAKVDKLVDEATAIRRAEVEPLTRELAYLQDSPYLRPTAEQAAPATEPGE
jgi:hypothetical protein